MASGGKLEGKVVMVTGASSGIGRDLCLSLASAGCLVVAAARRADRLKTLCEEITAFRKGNGAAAAAVVLDVSAEEAVVAAAVRKAWDAFGRIDGLVNNAGVRGGVYASVDWPKEEWDDVIRTNMTGTWLVSKHVCRLMRDGKVKGSVINVSSIAGLPRPRTPGAIAYDASKTAVHALTQAMALDMGAYNIRVNAIAPGLFKSEITAPLMEMPWLNVVAEKIVPLKTLGTTDPAITMLLHYLLHDSSNYISGNVFIVDSGTTLAGVPLYSSLLADELMVARIVSTDMGLSMPPQPISSCIRRRPEDLLPLGLGGGGWSGEFNYKRLQGAFIGEEEDGTRTIQGGVRQLSHFVHVWQEQIMKVQNEQPLVLQRLEKASDGPHQARKHTPQARPFELWQIQPFTEE